MENESQPPLVRDLDAELAQHPRDDPGDWRERREERLERWMDRRWPEGDNGE
jgi:hypothetical protein